MSLLTEKVCLFTGFKAKVTFEGQPAVGADILIRNEWGKKVTELALKTDQDGYFSFDSVYDKAKKFSIVEFVSYQEIYVTYQSEEYRIWGGVESLMKLKIMNLEVSRN